MKPGIRSFWLLAALVLACAAARAPGAPRLADQVQIAGKEYVRVSDWAKAHDLEGRWLKRDETLQLANRSTKFVLQLDSREAEVNGVKFWLCFPLAERDGAVYLARLDLQTTLQPLVSPPKNRPGAAIKTVCLDPGHGGNDPGFCVGSRQEKKYTLLLALEVRDQLSRLGFNVVLTRSRDVRVELSARPEFARQHNADLFVSLHFNSAGSSPGSVRGAEVYCLTPAGAPSTNARGEGGGAGSFAGNRSNDKNLFLACQLQRALCKGLVEDRGVKRARFEVLRNAAMPAVLIEAGFLSHPAEGRRIAEAGYRRQLARAITEGLLAYKGAVE